MLALVRSLWRLTSSATICLAAYSATALAGSSQTFCEVKSVKVVASTAQDAADACKGAKDAIDFFKAEQLKADMVLDIHVQSSLPGEASPSAVGCFVRRDGKVVMLPYAKFRKSKTWFDVPIDRRLYRSLAAHEVAHALAACNFSIPNPSIQAQEYIAYVTMFSTMDPALREQILAANPISSGSAVRLTALLYMFDPMRFGIESFRHFVEPGNGRNYIHEVLAGKALSD